MFWKHFNSTERYLLNKDFSPTGDLKYLKTPSDTVVSVVLNLLDMFNP